jgi:hypothetical protein
MECNIIDGITIYTLNKQKHREDGPAVMNETQIEWWFKGKKHRDNGPAIEMFNGSKLYYKHGVHHRLDGPAIELSNGLREWWIDGKRHNDDGPAYTFGRYVEWWKNGLLHKSDGPARFMLNCNGSTSLSEYWINGERHREDGPAVFNKNKMEWWLYGNRYDSEEDYENKKKEIRNELSHFIYNDLKVCKDVSKYISLFVI